MRTDPVLRRLANATLLIPFPSRVAPRWVLDELENGLGGVVLFYFNIGGPRQMSDLTRRLREAGGDPIVSLDEEGGDVTRLGHLTASPYPGNAALGAVDDTALTRRVYRALGEDLRAVGVTVNLAPSVDVNAADDNPVIGTRAFGADPEMVARQGVAAIKGLRDAGIAACAKHFPGHGATRQDSHHGLPTVDADLDELDVRELPPFRAAIEAGVDAVMTAHVRIPSVTGDEPATLSPAAITGLLRGRLGYGGPVITDALEMRGASELLGVPEASVRALLAGADLLCLGAEQGPEVVAATREAIVAAVREGRLPGDRLEEAARHATLLRRVVPPRGEAAARPERDGADVGLDAARRAIRVRGTIGELRAPLIVEIAAPPGMAVGNVPWGLGHWLPVDGGEHQADVARVAPETDPAPLLDRARDRSLVVVVRDAHRYPHARTLVDRLVAGRPDAVVVEMGIPAWAPDSGTHVATYGATAASARATLDLLLPS
ncbi:MAG TPA: glycoside hydrolase family 3 N-terminal domain-containing protein [Streptosporangiaceae bacterium]|jgi:beta-N-acetylhexosaminidase